MARGIKLPKLKKGLLKFRLVDLRKSLVGWIPVGIAITGLSGIVYLAAQQTIRLSADDPQVQISEEIIDAIAGGMKPSSILPPTPGSDMAKDLAPFVVIYSDSGEAVGSSTQLDGKIPGLPSGLSGLVAKKGESRFTWEPKKGLRSAVVARKYDGGLVLVGRSLREPERRLNLLSLYIAAGWALTMISSFASKAILDNFERKKR